MKPHHEHYEKRLIWISVSMVSVRRLHLISSGNKVILTCHTLNTYEYIIICYLHEVNVSSSKDVELL